MKTIKYFFYLFFSKTKTKNLNNNNFIYLFFSVYDYKIDPISEKNQWKIQELIFAAEKGSRRQCIGKKYSSKNFIKSFDRFIKWKNGKRK